MLTSAVVVFFVVEEVDPVEPLEPLELEPFVLGPPRRRRTRCSVLSFWML